MVDDMYCTSTDYKSMLMNVLNIGLLHYCNQSPCFFAFKTQFSFYPCNMPQLSHTEYISDGRQRILHTNRIRQRIQPAMQLPEENANPDENQGGPLYWQEPQINHQFLDDIPTEDHQPEDPPVLVPVEDHAVKTQSSCLTATLNV